MGKLDGPVDLFSKELMISRISQLDTCAITKFISLRFLRNLEGDILGTFGIDFPVLDLTLTKK